MAAVRSSVPQKPSALMAEQALHFPPALLLALLHRAHFLHPGSHRGALLLLLFIQEQCRSEAAGGAADSALRGQVLHQAAVL